MTALPVVAWPSATVVLLRDAPTGPGFEVLLLRRHDRLAFHGGQWVFPGGRVEAADAGGCHELSIDAARRAAVRETREEAGLEIEGESLIPIAHWTTPEHMPRRFSTWFFAARVHAAEVYVDGHEITAHRFSSPRSAIEAHRGGAIRVPAPTLFTLLELAGFESATEYLEAARLREPPRFLPRYRDVPGGPCVVLPGDAAYEGAALEIAGPRHRLWLAKGGGWRYERSP